jgi:hypothetical protein
MILISKVQSVGVKMKRILGGLVLLFCMNSSFAAFPPFAETALYINAILANHEVIERLGIASPIHSVVRQGNIFVVSAGQCSLQVEIKHRPQAGPMPPSATPPFDVQVGTLTCN